MIAKRQLTSIRFQVSFFWVTACLFFCCAQSVSGQSTVIRNGSGSLEVSRSLTPEKVEQWTHFLSRHPGYWTITVDDRGIMSAAAVSDGEFFANFDEQSFQAWLRMEAPLLGVDQATLDSLTLTDQKDTPGCIYYTYQSRFAGIEVFDSTLDLKISKKGHLLGIINHLQPNCQPSNLETFERERALANLKQLYSQQLLGDDGAVIYVNNRTCQLVIQCHILLPLVGYERPVETFCLADENGHLLFRKARTVPYRPDATE
ncbi:hypothetical protein ACFL27_22270 [candidate division CSSED10-310 bacterium]|uniref:FTP domain-containing protein n=1 Tax=candidate division CSSED10-310 bacterium TaxID=2855610 RepID=A0ABV6Z3A8_UNCC1